MAYKHGLIILEKSKEPDKFRGSKTHKKCYFIIHQRRHFRTSAAEGFFIEKVFTERNGFYVVLIIQIVTTFRTNFKRYL